MNTYLKQISYLFKQKNHELEQSIYRVIFTGIIFVMLCVNYNNVSSNAFIFCGSYLALGVLMMINIIQHPKSSVKRQWVSLVMDTSATSYGIASTGSIGGVFTGVFLWLIVGYGLRYGQKMLRAAHVLAILGFAIAIQFNQYWLTHMHLVYGLFITLLLVPLHTQALLKRLDAAIQKAELANQAKSQFLSHISHEIRTPLNGIVGASDLMSLTTLNSEQKELNLVLRNSSSLLVSLLNNVLDLSKIESGKVESIASEFNLKTLIEEVTSLFQVSAQTKKIALIIDINDEIPTFIRADQIHLKQILTNLLGNAVKFTLEGSVTLKVSLFNVTEIKFEIIDTGIGIDPKAQKHIFDSFSQANPDIKYQFGGTGLGTTISKQLVALLNGEIGLNSTPGIGSNFWFSIPVEIIHSNNTKMSQDNESIVNLKEFSLRKNKNKRKLNILVAEDNHTNQLIISKILHQAGYNAVLVENGNQVLDLLEENSYDLMILDSNMPELNGLETLKIHLVTNLGKPKVPVVILSADASQESMSAFMSAGADAYLTKPFDATKLLNQIETLTLIGSSEPAEIIEFTNRGKSEYQKTKITKFSRLDELAKLDPTGAFLETLISSYINDTELQLEELKKSAIINDYAAIKFIGHALGGSASNIGDDELVAICNQFSKLLPNNHYLTKQLAADAANCFAKSRVTLIGYLNQKAMAVN